MCKVPSRRRRSSRSHFTRGSRFRHLARPPHSKAHAQWSMCLSTSITTLHVPFFTHTYQLICFLNSVVVIVVLLLPFVMESSSIFGFCSSFFRFHVLHAKASGLLTAFQRLGSQHLLLVQKYSLCLAIFVSLCMPVQDNVSGRQNVI